MVPCAVLHWQPNGFADVIHGVVPDGTLFPNGVPRRIALRFRREPNLISFQTTN